MINIIMDKLLWYIFAGTRGGINRARIVILLRDHPYNTNQIAEELNLDYKTVKHHLKVLEENRLITSEGNGYGKVNFLSQSFERDFNSFLEIWNHVKQHGGY